VARLVEIVHDELGIGIAFASISASSNASALSHVFFAACSRTSLRHAVVPAPEHGFADIQHNLSVMQGRARRTRVDLV
jgi:hypothetical protein